MPQIPRFFKDGLFKRPQLVVGLYVILVAAFFMVGTSYYIERVRKNTALNAVEVYSLTLIELHKYYSEHIALKAEASGFPLTDRPELEPNKLPLPATMTIQFGSALARKEMGLSVALYSQHPFAMRQDRALDPYQQEAIAFFDEGNRDPFIRFEERDGLEIVRYALPVFMESGCVGCHNAAGLGLNWDVGDLRGVREASIPVAQIDDLENQIMVTGIFFALVTALLGSVLMLPTVRILQGSLNKRKEIASLLISQNGEMQEAAQIKNRILQGVSHDLKNPLNSIIGFSDILLKESFGPLGNEKYRTYVETIHESGRHMNTLLSHLTDLEKVKSGEWPVKKEYLDPERFLDELSPVLRNWVESSDIDFCSTVETSSDRIEADRLALRRIIVNLVDNAIKYSKASRIQVRIFDTAGSRDSEGSANKRVALEVRDNGTGLPCRNGHVEELLRQGNRGDEEDNASEKPDGTGLGLWLVKHFVKLHQAELQIDNNPGQGCCFRIVF
ncbi:ATP-binding protein [Kiloniella sp. b19]|uniref:ATP-binding protein n=1 Tax=Kiloniella sp. GXU_MW_B19 TaxID=3141326 RepID=UPI0031DE3E30